MLSYIKDMEMVRSWHLVLYKYKTKQWGKKNDAKKHAKYETCS